MERKRNPSHKSESSVRNTLRSMANNPLYSQSVWVGGTLKSCTICSPVARKISPTTLMTHPSLNPKNTSTHKYLYSTTSRTKASSQPIMSKSPSTSKPSKTTGTATSISLAISPMVTRILPKKKMTKAATPIKTDSASPLLPMWT